MADCIEREAAFNAILKLVPKVDGDGYCWVIRGDAARAIDSIPSADVAEVVHGEWIKDEDGCVVCSICSNPDEINGISGEFMYNNFCANCGADMRGGT